MVDETICPFLEFKQDLISIEAGWKKSHRTDIRRQIKKINQLGKLELTFIKDKTKVLSYLPKFFDMHIKKWKSQNNPSEFSTLEIESFIMN